MKREKGGVDFEQRNKGMVLGRRADLAVGKGGRPSWGEERRVIGSRCLSYKDWGKPSRTRLLRGREQEEGFDSKHRRKEVFAGLGAADRFVGVGPMTTKKKKKKTGEGRKKYYSKSSWGQWILLSTILLEPKSSCTEGKSNNGKKREKTSLQKEER